MSKKTILATTIGLSLVVAVNTAQAGSLATAFMDVDNFIISIGNTGVTADANTDLQGLVFNSNAIATASLTGHAPITSGTINSSDPSTGIDLYKTLGVVPAGYTENTYSSHIFSSSNGEPSANYAFGDQLEIGAPVDNLPSGSTAGARIYNQSTASIVNSGEAGATSNNGLVANWEFVAGFNDFLTFDFDLAFYLETFVSNDLVNPSTANSGASQIFTLVDIANPTVDLLVGGSKIITLNSGVNSPGDGGVADFVGFGLGVPFTAHQVFTSQVLTVGNEYKLTANIQTNASTLASVPEPSTIALLGLGLIGVSLSSQRKIRQAK